MREEVEMASKNSITRTRPADRGTTKSELKQLSRGAKAEVSRLLKRSRAGTITGIELQTRLRELSSQLDQMWVFIFKV